MHSFRSRRLTVTVACVLSAPAFAQNSYTSPTELDPIIVTATRSPEPLEATIGDNSVISRTELDKMPDATLAEVLGRQRGITFVNYGGPQTLSTVNVRGTNSNQTLVLIDGVRVNNSSNGLPPLNAIPASAIERIEIVRGAASSLYGADAIGGVINIITRKRGDGPISAFVNAGVGTYATSQYDAGLSGSTGKWSYNVYGGYGQSAGFNATNQENFYYNPDKDSYYRSNVGGSLSLEWASDQTLTVQTLQSRVNGGIDNGRPYFNDRGIQELSTNTISSSNRINEQWTSILTASLMVDKYESLTIPTASTSGQQYYRTEQTQYTWQNNFNLSEDQTLTLGYERLNQKVNGSFSDFGFPQASYVGYDGQEVFTNAFFAGYEGSWGIHSVQASVRNDYNSQYKNFTSGSLNYAIDITDQWRASVGASTGFRAPNFNELYWPQTSSFVGNPTLEPEKSKNLEAGLRYLTSKGQFAVAAYWNEITNAIINEPTQPGSFVYTPVNIGKAKIRGVTLSGDYAITDSFVVDGSFDWLSAVNSDTNTLLPLRAQRVLKLGANYQLGEFEFDAEWFLTSARKEVFSDDFLGGYGLVNLGIAYDWDDHATIRLQWNNVLGKSYNLVEGYNTPGSNIFVNLNLRY
jgi:vitamin B12 transporter